MLAELPTRFEVVGAFDTHRDAAFPAGLHRFASEAEAITACDLLVVASPVAAHTATALRALRAGRAVLVEKALCGSTAEGDRLVAQARASGRLFVGHSERFNPVVRALARLLRGDVVVALDFHRAGPSRSECSVLLNLGVHDLDLAAYLGGGTPVLRGAVGGDDVVDVVFTVGAGAAGHLHADRTGPVRRRALTVTTSRWTYEGDLLAHRLSRTPREGGAATEVPLPVEEPLLAQAIALADALDGAGEARLRELATGEDGALAVALAEGASSACAEKLSVRAGP